MSVFPWLEYSFWLFLKERIVVDFMCFVFSVEDMYFSLWSRLIACMQFCLKVDVVESFNDDILYQG